jgi:hypothetical protein
LTREPPTGGARRLTLDDVSQAVAIIIGAILGAVLAVGGSITVVELQARHQRHDERDLACRKAYSDLLATSHNLLQYTQMMHLTMAIRSGITEGWDVVSKTRKADGPAGALGVDAPRDGPFKHCVGGSVNRRLAGRHPVGERPHRSMRGSGLDRDSSRRRPGPDHEGHRRGEMDTGATGVLG